MKIKRSKKIVNGVEEHRWHYDRNTCQSWSDQLKVNLSMFYASHLLFHSIFYSAPLFLVYWLHLISRSTLLLIIACYFATYLVYKPFECKHNSVPWYPAWFKKHAFWEWMKFYADWLAIRRGADDVYRNKQFLFCIHPHAILACNRIQMLGHVWFDEIMPAKFGRYAAAWPQFYVPGVRETSIGAAAVDASKRVLNTVFSNGESVYLWVGGTKELLLTDPTSKQTEMVVLDRYGFIKLALLNGVDIVPVCQFGEKWIYRMHRLPSAIGSILYKFFKTPGILFWGRFCSLIPYHERENGQFIRMGMVIDTPIKVGRKMTEKEIDFERDIKPIHDEYIKRMQRLFEQYKSEFHYGEDEKLTFVSCKG